MKINLVLPYNGYTFTSMKQTQTNRKEKNQGMNWIRQEKRLAIYLRDGLACAYCGQSVTDGAKLTLDHIKAYSKGGSNHETNLITACITCNSARGNRSWGGFAEKAAGYLNHGITKADIVKHITNCRSRKLDIELAKELISRQGSCFEVLKNQR